MAWWFKSTHDAFALASWLMGILGSIVETFMLSMLDLAQKFLLCCPIARQFIRDQHAWEVLTAFQQFTKELLRCRFSPSALNQNVQHMPILVDRSPKIVQPAIDFEEHLIKMPFVSGRSATSA
jgi:hypothetical protein